MLSLLRTVKVVKFPYQIVSQRKEKAYCQWIILKLFNIRRENRNFSTFTTRFTVPSDKMSSTEKKAFSRLPTLVAPYHYEISLAPDLATFIFIGSEKIYVEVKQPTKVVVLNSIDIDIKSANFNGNDGNVIPAKVELSLPDETAIFTFNEELPIGKTGSINLEFAGEINNSMKGLYRSKHIYEDGTEEYSAVTQFEATDARRCFPCWDEPALKAFFDITLKVPIGLTALSNMPVKNKIVSESMEILTFERTPFMSTYLVAVAVGKFDYVEAKSSDGVLVRVYTQKNKEERGRFALEVATKILPYYKEYFGIAYPLPKMDLIAVADFAMGAMENWGLVTYRDSCLLVDPQNTSTDRKQWIALVVAHELAHQWFGNLVTMEWWTHLWLNEGYATFVEYLCVAHLFPEYDIWTQFVADTYVKALELDALKNSHPIEIPVGHPSEIDEIFDDISYEKGACVIRMLHQYIGDSDFRKGMNLYLTRHSYSNTETEDLWTALEEASKKSIRSVMSTWTKQQGFPVVKVDYFKNGDHWVLSLKQERFLADGSTDDGNTLWSIPISVVSSNDPAKVIFSDLLQKKSQEFLVEDSPSSSWLKLNPGTVGFYRTRYSPNASALLAPAISDHLLPPLDRLGLLDDLFAMVQAGHASTTEVLELLSVFKQEDNFTVWCSIFNILVKIGVLASHLDKEEEFKAYWRSLMQNINVKLGWDPKPNENHLDTLLRSVVIRRMATLNDEATMKEAKKRFDSHISGQSVLSADLRSAVYRAVLANGDQETFQTLVKLFREADLQEEKDRILRSFGAIKDEALLAKVLQFSLSSEVRATDTIITIASVATTYKGSALAWDFCKQNWKTLVTRYESCGLIARLIKFTTENFVTEEKATEIEEFFKENSARGAERAIQQSVESIRLNAAWLSRDQQAINKFFS
ncbi:puromycin-sensitive aminopeptidase [Prorops nasuta]|uniref:puromycin-sensitive aminopeptidase n=1 Tax=Prorops nasuta TaxID=863751 RepID=UPI0034CE077B